MLAGNQHGAWLIAPICPLTMPVGRIATIKLWWLFERVCADDANRGDAVGDTALTAGAVDRARRVSVSTPCVVKPVYSAASAFECAAYAHHGPGVNIENLKSSVTGHAPPFVCNQ